MTWSENLMQNLLTIGILGSLVIIVYAKITKKTLGDMIREIREAMSDKVEEVPELVQGGFESIR